MISMLQFISAKNLPKNEGVIIDVRTKAEHMQKQLAQTHTLVPLDQLNVAQFIAENNITNDQTIYILCRSGGRAIPAAEMFVNAGHTRVKIIDGGILACETSGIEVI